MHVFVGYVVHGLLSHTRCAVWRFLHCILDAVGLYRRGKSIPMYQLNVTSKTLWSGVSPQNIFYNVGYPRDSRLRLSQDSSSRSSLHPHPLYPCFRLRAPARATHAPVPAIVCLVPAPMLQREKFDLTADATLTNLVTHCASSPFFAARRA